MKKLRIKNVYTVFAILLLCAIYVGIFLLSSEVGEDSTIKSSAVTRFLLKIYDLFQTDGSMVTDGVIYIDTFPVDLEKLVRKAAHFSEYCCVGFLSYSLVLLWFGKAWKGRLVVFLQLVLSAALDEFHQYFVPGRYAAVKDVVIDTVGGSFGMLLIFLGYVLWRKHKKRQCVNVKEWMLQE